MNMNDAGQMPSKIWLQGTNKLGGKFSRMNNTGEKPSGGMRGELDCSIIKG